MCTEAQALRRHRNGAAEATGDPAGLSVETEGDREAGLGEKPRGVALQGVRPRRVCGSWRLP